MTDLDFIMPHRDVDPPRVPKDQSREHCRRGSEQCVNYQITSLITGPALFLARFNLTPQTHLASIGLIMGYSRQNLYCLLARLLEWTHIELVR